MFFKKRYAILIPILLASIVKNNVSDFFINFFNFFLWLKHIQMFFKNLYGRKMILPADHRLSIGKSRSPEKSEFIRGGKCICEDRCFSVRGRSTVVLPLRYLVGLLSVPGYLTKSFEIYYF